MSTECKRPRRQAIWIFLNVFALKDVIQRIKGHSRKMVLFGSVSQGTDAPDSDIDLLILSTEKDPVRKKDKRV